MRINVYSQELTSEVRLISKESDGVIVIGTRCHPISGNSTYPRIALETGLADHWKTVGRPERLNYAGEYFVDIREEPIIYHAAQLMLHSSPMLHHPPHNDDRSAVTFWLPKSSARREEMAKAFERIAALFREAPSGTGLD
jgi:hypothetical protein